MKKLQPLAIVAMAVTAALGAAGAVLAVDRSMAPPSAVLPQAEDGHFWAQADTSGGPLTLLVDTGATRVSLTRQDAERLGVILTDDAFVETVTTAAGPARTARVTLDWVAIGPARVERVEAVVFRDGLSHSLLGMSYLGRLEHFAMRGGALRLEG